MDGVNLSARFIPFPTSVSPEARRTLQGFVDAKGNSLGIAPSPAPDDIAAWETARRIVNPMLAQRFGARLRGANVPLETLCLGGAVVHLARPERANAKYAYLDFHGGGLVYGGGLPCQLAASSIALQHGVLCYGVDYRMPPEHTYPAALDDAVAAYRALLERHSPENIIVGGGSAGGNLAAALMLRARDEGMPLPAALVLLTPEVDLTESGDTFETNRYLDVVLPLPLMAVNRMYAAGRDMSHPYLSPLFGDFTKGFPPTLLQSGTRDLFLSNAVRMHRALRRAGVPVELHVFEGMPHGGFMGAPEDAELDAEVRRFVSAHWDNRV